MESVDHSQREHALLSASGSARWLNCTPSAKLEEEYAKEHPSHTTSYAEEGTLAHEIAMTRLMFLEHKMKYQDYEKAINELRSNPMWSPDMSSYVEEYVTHVLEELSEARVKTKDAVFAVEEKIDFSHIVPEGFGSVDSCIIADGTLQVFDLKYGKGIQVDADNNSQMMLYALGAISAFDLLYDITDVKLTIIQPRLKHISTFEMTRKELEDWAEKVAKPKAELAFQGKGQQVPGAHCKFCKVKAQCKALSKFATESALQEFAENPKLHTIEELTELYEKVPVIIDWANSIGQFLLEEAQNGTDVPGYKVVEGISRRVFTDENNVIEALESEGYSREEFMKTSLKGIGEIEKLVGKKKFPDLLGDLVTKPQGKPTLVLSSDPRPAMNKAQEAKDDFLF